MKKLYQTEWHGIPFDSFAKVSSKKLADSDFYAAFYAKFFEKYRNWSDLKPEWVKLKLQAKQFIKEHPKFGRNQRVLSIGCGLGIMEKALLDEGCDNLEITEVSANPLQWLLPHFPKNQVYIGFFPECIPEGRHYDLIYLSGVEYFFDQKDMIKFLKAVRSRLAPYGVCLMISWSYEFKTKGPNILRRFVILAKQLAYSLLARLGLKPRILGKPRQFWGYLRNQSDFMEAMRAAGFSGIRDGFLEKKTDWDTYYIEGVNGGAK
jgi:SAM-dependent methyltransferase